MDENEDLVKVYPNPTKQLVIVEAEGMTEVSVYNTLGQCVLRKEVSGHEATIDMQGVGLGLYLFQVKMAEGTVCRRVSVVD